MLFTPVLIRHLWQLKTVCFLHRCLCHAVLLLEQKVTKNIAIYFGLLYPFQKLPKMAKNYPFGSPCPKPKLSSIKVDMIGSQEPMP